ncbi:LysR family transcriptional regulator [Microbacterium sp. NPDC019599]|uniref:LysR family transcriptional regulator n=1 Tax=Microbacterium sp. NPDC019599 TaxID=3154690 RepID=UPI00340B134A
MKIAQLRRFVVLADNDLHVPRAAEALGIPLASLYSTIEKLEAETGHPVVVREGSGWKLTPAGSLLLEEARRQIAAADPKDAEPAKPAVKAGGKAKASKGKGRAPIVKGQPKPYKKRQGR